MSQDIINILLSHDGSMSEYQLLKEIELHLPDFFSQLSAPVSLYKKHFFLFNHLYRLKQQLTEESLHLCISPLEIKLVPAGEAGQKLGAIEPLRDFYLQLDNIHLSEVEISKMQRQFWEKYLAIDKKAEALKILQLTNISPVTHKVLKSRFNELARKHHPDRGGDEQMFIMIKQAYEDLKLVINR